VGKKLRHRERAVAWHTQEFRHLSLDLHSTVGLEKTVPEEVEPRSVGKSHLCAWAAKAEQP